jgi:hypothetical protein
MKISFKDYAKFFLSLEPSLEGEKMKANKLLVVFYTVVLLFSYSIETAKAANISIRSETMVRFFERNTRSKNDALIVPAYQFLEIDWGETGVNSLTFHANGWGRIDLTDNDYFEDQSDGELLYGYLQYQSVEKGIFARLGRQAVVAGVANESLNGLYLKAAFNPAIDISVYGGSPVSLDNTDGHDGDSIYGGRLGFRLAARYNFGVSYKMIRNDSTDAEEMAGVDIGLSFDKLFITGASSYNLITDGFAEHSYEALFSYAENRFNLFYQHYTFEDYFDTGANNANPFRIMAQTSEKLSTYGLDITHNFPNSVEGGIKLARNDYDHGNASNYGALVVEWYGEDLSGIGGEFGVSRGGENDQNDMVLARIYGYKEITGNRLIDQLSCDLLYAKYGDSIYGEDTSVFVSLAGSRKIVLDNLRLKLSADYESGPYFDDDYRGMVSLIYLYSNK